MFWQFSSDYQHNIALRFNGESISYARLQTLCNITAEELPEQGSLVFLMCRNDLETIATYLACLQKRVTVMMLDANIHDEKLSRLTEAYQPHTIVSEGRFHSTGFPQATIDNNLAILLSTSGSTGTAKQVCLSYENLQANAESICGYLPIDSSDITLTTLPCYYSYGLSVLNTHLLKGACTIVSEVSAVSREFWQYLKDDKITSFAGVPYTYEMLYKLGFLRKEHPHLRYLTQAGGRLADNLVIAFSNALRGHNQEFFVMYGQTEATARMAFLSPKKLPDKAGAIGQAIPGGEFGLIDSSGNPVAHGEGELVYKGPNVMLGYASCRKELNGFEPTPELRTGDVAIQDKDGDYHIVGRLKRFVKVFGLRINLDEVEQILAEQGFTAKVTGSDKVIYIALNKSQQEKTAVDYLSKALKLHASVLKAGYLPQFPVNANNKTDYHALKNWFEEGRQGD